MILAIGERCDIRPAVLHFRCLICGVTVPETRMTERERMRREVNGRDSLCDRCVDGRGGTS